MKRVEGHCETAKLFIVISQTLLSYIHCIHLVLYKFVKHWDQFKVFSLLLCGSDEWAVFSTSTFCLSGILTNYGPIRSVPYILHICHI